MYTPGVRRLHPLLTLFAPDPPSCCCLSTTTTASPGTLSIIWANWGPRRMLCATTRSPCRTRWRSGPRPSCSRPAPATRRRRASALALTRARRRHGRAASGGVPRPPGHRRGLRRHRPAPLRDRAWQDGRDPPPGRGRLRRPAFAAEGDALPFAGGRPCHPARRAGGDGGAERWHDHGGSGTARWPSRACSSTPKASGPSMGTRC